MQREPSAVSRWPSQRTGSEAVVAGSVGHFWELNTHQTLSPPKAHKVMVSTRGSRQNQEPSMGLGLCKQQ